MYLSGDDIGKCRPWLALQSIPGVGDAAVRQLVAHFCSAEAALKAVETRTRGLDFLHSRARAFLAQGARPDYPLVDKACEALASSKIWMLTFQDAAYPKSLKVLKDPPPVIYGLGRMELLYRDSVAIVGARQSSSYGNRLAFEMARDIASKGIAVVSGLAMGIDFAAHQGALTAEGSTIAVKGCGIDVYYPRHDRRVLDALGQNGLIISQFIPTFSPDARNFPIRNRIISALSKGVVVVEAGLKSGSMITASCALNQGKDVMAVPGSVLSSSSAGTNWLIKQGAMLVENATDVLNYLGIESKPGNRHESVRTGSDIDRQALQRRCASVKCIRADAALQDGNIMAGRHTVDLSDDEKKVLSCLASEPRHFDDISHEAGMEIPKLSAVLIEMELKDLIQAMPGQFYVMI